MVTATDHFEMVDSRYQDAALCVVCGNEIAAGEGLSMRYAGRIVRFKCSGCLSRFETDPERYLAGHQAGCCGHESGESPASEWCD